VDLRTVVLMLAIGSFLFGILLVLFKYNNSNPQEVPYWITAKFLQAAGSMMLFYRIGTYDGFTVLANASLLLGCAYEAWAIRILSGQDVRRQLHILTSIGITLVCSISLFLDSPYRIGLIFLLQSSFYFLPSLFLLKKSGLRFSLQIVLAICYFLTGSVFLISAVISLIYIR
jgi:hypothetical protein